MIHQIRLSGFCKRSWVEFRLEKALLVRGSRLLQRNFRCKTRSNIGSEGARLIPGHQICGNWISILYSERMAHIGFGYFRKRFSHCLEFDRRVMILLELKVIEHYLS